MKASLNTKIFITTFATLIFLSLSIVIFIVIYFNLFYEQIKLNTIIDKINLFASEYVYESWSEEDAYQHAYQFMANQNATLFLFTDEESLTLDSTESLDSSETTDSSLNNAIAEGFYVFSVEDESKTVYSLTLDSYALLATFDEKVPEPKTVLHISGIFDSDYTIIPNTINNIIQSSFLFGVPLDFEKDFTIISSSFIPFDDTDNLDLLTPSDASDSFSVPFYLEGERDGVNYTITTFYNSPIKQVDFIKEIQQDDGLTTAIYVHASLQSVDEIISFSTTYYPYYLIFASLLSLLLSSIFSKYVSKPILLISSAAKKMATFNFDGHVPAIHRKDEVGQLASSLNTLSTNLKKQEVTRREFVANVSHELKSPLGVIKSYAEALGDNINTDKKVYYTKVIQSEVNRMDDLLQEMLLLSKHESGIIQYNKVPTDLRQLLMDIITLYQQKIEDRQLTFQIKGEFARPSIDVDKIKQVLINLIDNAITYSYASSTILIQGTASETTVTVHILNDCTPFDEEALTKVWNRFYKVDTSHNRNDRGTGLGLAVCKSILDGHHSTYGVNNTPTGVDFFITL